MDALLFSKPRSGVQLLQGAAYLEKRDSSSVVSRIEERLEVGLLAENLLLRLFRAFGRTLAR